MRNILANLLLAGFVVGIAAFSYMQYKILKSDLPQGSGGGGKKRPAKKNP